MCLQRLPRRNARVRYVSLLYPLSPVCIEVMDKLQKAVDENKGSDVVKVVDDTCSTFTGKQRKIVRLFIAAKVVVFEYWCPSEFTNAGRE